jgi:hypothetical protein
MGMRVGRLAFLENGFMVGDLIKTSKAVAIWWTPLLFTLASQVAFGNSDLNGKYISPDHSFELSVPAGYSVQTGKTKPSRSYIPVCHNDSLVCITVASNRFSGTTFGDASVEVMLLAVNTEQACMNDSEFQIDAKHPSRRIDGRRFLHAFDEGAAMSHYIETHRYRGYNRGRCYELALHVTFTNYKVYDPGTIKEFTSNDEEQVITELKRIIDSFRFL